MSAPVLDVRRVSRRYGRRLAVGEASFRLEAGRLACLLGPSGCGKSTLLRLIAGLEPIDEGEIAIGGTTVSMPGREMAPEQRGVGLVFQDFALFPHLTVAANVGFGLSQWPAAQRRERVARQLARFHLEHLAEAWPHTLSGGEQQRVAIARALAREPTILLLDEPFSGLDEHLRAQVRRSVLADLRASGTSVLIVTHDPEEALLMADDMILMAAGRILQTGTPQECYQRPATLAAARLLGEVTILPATVSDGIADTPIGPVPASGIADGPTSVFFRPEALRLDGRGVRAHVVSVGFAGPFLNVELEAGQTRFFVRMTGRGPQVGDSIEVALDPGAAVGFDPR